MTATVERSVSGLADPPRRPEPLWMVSAGVICLGTVVGITRLPFLGSPVTSDEGGFLVLGAQWGPGSSLYGNYWVDRPPLLIAVFAGAGSLGGPTALRLIGVVAVVLAICAAGAVGWYASGRRQGGAFASACTAAAFLATPLLGTRIVDGELLACPLVLIGLACLLATHGRTGAGAVVLCTLAGVAGAGAFLVKQDMVDVFVVAAVLALHTGWRRGLRPAVSALLPLAAGTWVTTSAVTALAASRGTPLNGLWTAVVTFRVAAAGHVGFSGARLWGLVHAYVVTGALAVSVAAGLVLLGSRSRSTSSQWGVAACALTVWELAAVVAGGSYWSHYLVGLVPGVALLVAVAFDAPSVGGRRLLVAALLYAGAATLVAGARAPLPPASRSDDQVTAAYVRDHARPGDSMVVAFGHADIVQEAGLGSPYPYLWALPAFVEDPRLARLDGLLRSSVAPRWFVAGGDLGRWGPPGAAVERTLEARYSVTFRSQTWVVWRERSPRHPDLPSAA